MTERESVPGIPTSREVLFDDPTITEFKKAIVNLGGHILETGELIPERFRVIDTASRLVAVLYEKVLYGRKATQLNLVNMDKEDESHHIRGLVEGTSLRKYRALFLDSAMNSIPIVLSKGLVSKRVSPTGVIGLSALARLPMDKFRRREIRNNARGLISHDSVATQLYEQNPGFFNGEVSNTVLTSVIDQIIKPTPAT